MEPTVSCTLRSFLGMRDALDVAYSRESYDDVLMASGRVYLALYNRMEATRAASLAAQNTYAIALNEAMDGHAVAAAREANLAASNLAHDARRELDIADCRRKIQMSRRVAESGLHAIMSQGAGDKKGERNDQ